MAFNSIFRGRIQHLHIVGIGGIGMSAIARILLQSGFKVSGSDLSESPTTMALRELGAQIYIGHHQSHIGPVDVVAHSTAIKSDNPELVEALRLGIPVISRAVILAELMRLRCGIAISGAHGKTTTTSLIGTLMHTLGLDPTIVIGGVINHFGANAVLGQSQFMVTEADESDGTFLHLSPTIAVVTNIDAEHLDYYQGGITEIKAKFTQFLDSVPFYGAVVACVDDDHVREICRGLTKRVITYGLDHKATYGAVDIEHAKMSTSFTLTVEGKPVTRATISMVGRHNVRNALASIAVLVDLGIDIQATVNSLIGFTGVSRRFAPLYFSEQLCVIDDYAHHPTEIKAVINAARASFKEQKIRVLFQPHRYSRTKDLLHEFAHCFDDCDSLVVTDIYAAQETPIEGITSEKLVDTITKMSTTRPVLATSLDDGIDKIVSLTRNDDIVLTLGAGSIGNAGPKLIEQLHIKHGIDYAGRPQ